GRFAISGLIRMVASFQLLVFIMFAINEHFRFAINLDPEKILKGEVWRLVTYVFIPRTSSGIWVLIQVWFLWFISDGIERAWGSFRLNLYFLGSMLSLTLGCFLLRTILINLGVDTGYLSERGGDLYTGEFLYHSLFLAFAVIYPNQVIQFMLILPIKIKYLAWVLGGYLALLFFQGGPNTILIPFSLLPFALYTIPTAIKKLKLRTRVAERRSEYQAKSLPTDDAFHHCSECGKTEADDAHLEFRVTAEGEEYCQPCLEARRASKAPESEAH
ncbi:MAG: hypothetical protein ACC661_02725, partial [Verrucomicrobiales bacterium]